MLQARKSRAQLNMSIVGNKVIRSSSLIQWGLFGVLLALCLVPSTTHAFFTGSAQSETNTFTAGTLAFSIDDSSVEADVYDSGTTSIPIEITDDGTIATQYGVSVASVSCEDAFYDGLAVSLTHNGDSTYAGDFENLYASSTDDGTWELEITASSSIALTADTCAITLTFKAWQENIALFNTGGFYQEEDIEILLTAAEYLGSTVLLNEVLPNPEGLDTQAGLQGEWVELYNVSLGAVDVTNWYIEDEASNHIDIIPATTYNGQTTVASFGWAVVFMSGAVLNNTGDTVYLYDNNGVLRDRYSYGASVNDDDGDSNNTPSGDNTNPAGSEVSGQEGKSDARIPDGADNWVDPIPTPGAPNVLEEEQDFTFVASAPQTQGVPDIASTTASSSDTVTTTSNVQFVEGTAPTTTSSSSVEATTKPEEQQTGSTTDTKVPEEPIAVEQEKTEEAEVEEDADMNVEEEKQEAPQEPTDPVAVANKDEEHNPETL